MKRAGINYIYEDGCDEDDIWLDSMEKGSDLENCAQSYTRGMSE